MATLASRLTDLTTRIATEAKSLRTLLNGNQPTLASLNTTAKNNLVVALNEVKAAVDAIVPGATINDASGASTTQTYSITQILSLIATAKAQAKSEILNGAGAAFDTLAELQALLEGDAASITALNTAIGNRVRFDAAQTLSAPQKAQANANMGSAALADTGTLDTDFVSVFNTGIT